MQRRRTALALRVFAVMLIVVGVVTPVTTTLVTFIIPETFSATAMVAFRREPSRVFETEVLSPVVMTAVVRKWELASEWSRRYHAPEPLPESVALQLLQKRTAVSVNRRARVASVTVYDDRPDQVAYLANSIAESFLDQGRNRDAHVIVEQAVRPTEPVRPHKPLNIALGVLMGTLLAGSGVALRVGATRWLKSLPPPLPRATA